MAKDKLSTGDINAIAAAVNCHPKAVNLVLENKRGKRNTVLQKMIKDAAKYRIQQNEDFVAFCKTRELELVSLVK